MKKNTKRMLTVLKTVEKTEKPTTIETNPVRKENSNNEYFF